MTRVCPACHASGLPTGSRFCLACGEAVSAVDEAQQGPEPYTPDHLAREVLTSQTAREGERKEVTVLFADIAGSLAMAEKLDPEDIHAIMDGLFAFALDAVHEQRGTINQFRGDGFMALFGAPKTRGDDAVRALRAALAIRDRAEQYRREVRQRYAIPFVLRMGLHTGTVWVGAIGTELRKDYTAEGPTVGLAARLQELADPGQVLVSEETARRAVPFLELRDLGIQRVRGTGGSVRVFELVGPGLFEGRFDAERARGLTPFVGRERELERLESLLGSAEQAGHLVEIHGEAGIGKSRLVLELLSRVPAASLQARCRESGPTRAYSALLELLRRWPAALPGAADAARLALELGGESPGASATREEFTERVAQALEQAGRVGPLLVVVEDVHWVDPSSREVLRALFERGLTRQTLFLTTTRTELSSSASPAPGERLELGPLGPDESRALGYSIVRGIDDADALAVLAAERGGGNPLFVEEVARALREGTDETRRVAQLEVELLRSPGRIPATLTGVIAARIDALPDPAKRLLQAASVVGLPFDPDLLRRLEPEAEDDVLRLLDVLEKRVLLARGLDSAMEFRHVLVRDVAYGQLLLSRKRELHGRCAEALVERGLASRPEGASRIGAHYDLAGRPAQAARHLALAGTAYLKLHAPSEAAAHLERAFELLGRDPSHDAHARTSVGLALASALNGLDRASEAADVLEALQGETLDPGDRRRLARVWIEEGWVRFSEKNEVGRGRELIERGLALVRDRRDGRRVEMTAAAYLSRLYEQDGDIPRAVACAERLVALAVESDDRFFRIHGLGAKGSALCHVGKAPAGLTPVREAASLAEEAENTVAIGFASTFLAKVLLYVGEPEKVLEAAERARWAGERTRQVGILHHAATWSGHAYLLLDQAERAMVEFDRLSTINPRWPAVLAHRADGLLALGRWEQAAEAARQCLGLAPPRVVRVRALCALGLAIGLADPREDERSKGALSESIALCEQLGLRPQLAETKRALALLSSRRGETEKALYHAKEAATLFEECGMRLHASRVRRVSPRPTGWVRA